MKAIELKSKSDKSGLLSIKYKLNLPEKSVRVLILLEDESNEQEEEALWRKSISRNPSFDFLNDPAEDIYTLKDGEPFTIKN